MTIDALPIYACPHCGDLIGAMPNATVTHRCPRNKNRTTRYEPRPAGE